MFFTIVISAAVLVLVAGPVFLIVHLVPIITNLFLNVTVRRTSADDRPLAGETVTFTTADDVRLTGTLSTPPGAAPDAPIIVFCHEFTADRHSAGTYAWFLPEAGFRVFSFDFRGHGDSEHPAGYEPRQWVTEHEVCDLRAALRYLKGRRDLAGAKIGLFGMSRGAMVAIIGASGDPGVSAVVSDSAFSTPHMLLEYMRRWAPIFVHDRLLPMSKWPGVLRFFRALSIKTAEHRLGVKFVPLVPALRRLTQPLLMLHGEDDGYVRNAHARFLHEAAPAGTTLWIAPGADHNRAVDVAPDEYARRIRAFFSETLDVKPVTITARS